MSPGLHRALAPFALALASLALAPAARAQSAPEDVLVVDLLDNGSGDEPPGAPSGDPRARRVPWWSSSGAPRGEAEVPPALVLLPGEVLAQPIAAYAPLVAGLVVHGAVEGAGRVRLVDGRGGEFVLDVRDAPFEITGVQLAEHFGRAPVPRFRLELSAPAPSGGARFRRLHALVPLPLPDPRALAAELAEACDATFRTWVARAIDREGPRPTAFLTGTFDAVTGERLRTDPGGVHPLYESLLAACAVLPRDTWRAWLAAFLEDFLELTFHPETGLPRDWDGAVDLPQDAKPIEVARYLAFLLDVAELGPEEFRARAREQARRMGRTILERGLLGDGTIAVKYVPATGAPDLSTKPIRKLDVAAQLARLARLERSAEMTAAAAAALAQLEYLHYWGGSWDRIDPDFDDSYGNWGARATTMLAASPEHPVFARFAARGFEHFAPLWRDALRFGGSIAADQTRCWELLLDYAEVEPRVRAELEPLLRSAARAHFKGEQYDDGAWGDLTFADFSPRSVNVGDFSGTPSNLIEGLAALYRPGSGLRDDETRAMFTAVLRSTVKAYGRPYGWLPTRVQSSGQNFAYGDVRALAGLVEMLEHLSR